MINKPETIKFSLPEEFDSRSNETLRSLVTGEDIQIRFKLEEVLKDRGINSNELAKITGLRPITIRNIINHAPTTSLNLSHLVAIIIALRITDLSEFMEIVIDDATENKFKNDLKLWKENGWQPVYNKGQQD